MFDMLLYLSIPYDTTDENSKREARIRLQKNLASLAKHGNGAYGVNALFSEDPKMVLSVQHCTLQLINKCDKLVVLMYEGWKSNPQVARDLAIAKAVGKQVDMLELTL